MIRPQIETKMTGHEKMDRLKKALSKYRKAYVTVGVHQDAGEYKGDVSVVEVALFNEFGTWHIPKHPFMTLTLSKNEDKLNRMREEIIENIASGKWDIDKGLNYLGFNLMVMVQNQIKSNMPPENAESTKKAKLAKGIAPNTLMDSLLLLRSITYKAHLE